MEKYFVIGFNKTATLTFHQLFLQNGLTSCHNGKYQTNKLKIGLISSYVHEWCDLDSYMCFSDNGQCQDFKMLHAKYPNSIFILNLRRLDEWLISRFKHGLTYNQSWAYPYTEIKCKEWIKKREEYYKTLLDFFKDKSDKLIIVSIDENNWIQYISSELNFKITDIKSQHVFPTDTSIEEHRNIINIVNKSFNELLYTADDRKNILFKDKSLTEQYLNIFKNNISSH